jgi:hypothetical protein
MAIRRRPAGGADDEARTPINATPDDRKVGRPKKADKAEEFINEAPDGRKVGGRFKRGSKAQITLTIDEALLERVDAMARRAGISRAALVSISLGQILGNGLTFGKDGL